jgi:hypothetical protein
MQATLTNRHPTLSNYRRTSACARCSASTLSKNEMFKA